MSGFYYPPYWCHSCDMSIALPPSPTPNSLLCPHCHFDSLEQLDNNNTPFPSHNHNHNHNHFILPENDTPNSASTPAPKSSIDSLPEVVIKIDDIEMCPICKDPFVVHSVVKVMPCVHRFHSDCIVPWLEINNSCPVCRFKLPPPVVDVVEMESNRNRWGFQTESDEEDWEFDLFRIPTLRTR